MKRLWAVFKYKEALAEQPRLVKMVKEMADDNTVTTLLTL
jgi:hypothetical protein